MSDAYTYDTYRGETMDFTTPIPLEKLRQRQVDPILVFSDVRFNLNDPGEESWKISRGISLWRSKLSSRLKKTPPQ